MKEEEEAYESRMNSEALSGSEDAIQHVSASYGSHALTTATCWEIAGSSPKR